MSSNPEVIALASKKWNFLTPSKTKQAFEVSLRARNRREYQDSGNNTSVSGPKNFVLSASDMMNSNIDLVVDLKFRVEGDDWDAVSKLNDSIGLRTFPVNNALQNVSVTGLNGISPSENPYENVTFYSRMMSEELRSACSQAYKFDDSNGNNRTGMRNIYKWGNSTVADEQDNGFGNGYEVIELTEATVGGNAGVNVHLRIKERLQCQPFQWFQGYEPVPFNQVGQFQLALQFKNDALYRMVGTVTDVDAPTIKQFNSASAWDSSHTGALSVKAVIQTEIPSASISVPPRILYDAPRVNYYSTSTSNPTLAAGAEVGSAETYNLGNFTTVPSLWGIYIKEDENSNKTQTDYIDRHAVITELSIQIGSNNVALSDLDLEGLYRMSAKNGYNGTFGSFSGSTLGYEGDNRIVGNGQVIYFKPNDLALNDIFYVANSASQPINVAVSVKYKNPFETDFAGLNLYVLALEDNVVDTQYNKWSEYRPILTGAQITNAPVRITDLNESSNQLGGASVLESLKRGWKKALDFGKKHKEAINALSDVGMMVAPEVALPAKMAYDVAMATKGSALVPVAGKKAGRPKKKTGGKSMSQAQLTKLLKKL